MTGVNLESTPTDPSDRVEVRDGSVTVTWERGADGHGAASLRDHSGRVVRVPHQRWSPPQGLWFAPVAAAEIRMASRLVGPYQDPVFDDPLHVVRTYVEEFKNRQRFSTFPRLFRPDFSHRFDFQGVPGNMESWVRTPTGQPSTWRRSRGKSAARTKKSTSMSGSTGFELEVDIQHRVAGELFLSIDPDVPETIDCTERLRVTATLPSL